MPKPTPIHNRIRVTGRVQGVWYRKSAAERAIHFQLLGTVENMADGSVVIHAQGSRHNLDEFLSWCAEGPPKAKVAEVAVEELPFREYQDFKVLR